MPEIEAHAERLDTAFAGRVLEGFVPLNFTVLKTATPPPDVAVGEPLRSVGRRGKYLLLRFDPVVFVIHLMQGGRLEPDTRTTARPRGGQARFVFDDGPALLLTEQGSERRAGVWCVRPDALDDEPPLDRLGPEAVGIGADRLTELFAEHSMRLHGFLRDQRIVAGLGRRLANEVCHRARVSPFATTGRLGAEGAATVAAAIDACAAEGLDFERTLTSMSSSRDRPAAVHARTGEPCPEGHDTVRAVEYRDYTVNYCPTCQTEGRILADNTTSKFLK